MDSNQDKPYAAPEVKHLGSVSELTEQSFDKIGNSTDAYTSSIPGLDGKIVPDAP
jgi:hypothetical protein